MATETKSIPLSNPAFVLVAGPGLVSMHAQADDQVQICIAASTPSSATADAVNLPKGWSTMTVTTNNVYARSASREAVLLPVLRG